MAAADGPVVHIVSPVDGQAVAGGLLSVVVEFSAKLNSKGQPSGNVTHVDLLANGHVIAVYQNPPNIKSGTHTFVVDLSQFGLGPIQFSAVAYQGEGSSAPSESSSGVTVQIDTDPPEITGATPPNASLGISGSVEIRADLFDAGSGIDSPATRLTLDGADVTASSTRTTSRVSYMAAGLLDGPHAVKVDTADRAGNPAHLEWDFLLDLTDPFDVFTQPAEDVTVSTGRPMLTLTYSDPTANGYASGIDPATLEWFEDGRDVTAETVRGADSATYTPPADRPLSEGEHHYLAIVHDRAGRTHSAERVITVHIAPPPSVAIVLPGAITPLYAPPYLFTYSGTAPVTPTFARINGVDVLDRFQVTDTFAGYIPAVGDPVFLHAGPNLLEVGVVDGLGVAASASKIIGLVSGPGPATVPLVLTLKTGIALHAVSHRPTVLIELVAQAGLGGAAVPGVALSAEFPGGFVQPAPPLSLVTNDLGFAGFFYIPGALTGTENSEVVHLTIRAKDYPDATPLDVPVTVYRPTLEVSFSVPEHSEESAQVFDDKIAVGASSHLVSARLTGTGVSGAEAAVRFEIGRGTGADFVPDATLGDWMPEEVFREMGADCNSSLFVLAPADAATVRISAPEFPESGVKEYSVALVAKRERAMAVYTALPEGGFDITLPTVSVGSPFKSGNGQIVVHNGTLGTPLVLDLREYNAALRDTGAGAPAFSIYYTLLGPGHALPSSPYDWAMHVDSLGADEVALPILPSVSFEPAQMLLLFITGSTADNGSGVFASIEAWEVGNLGPAELRILRVSREGSVRSDFIPYPDPELIDDGVREHQKFWVEARVPVGLVPVDVGITALDQLGNAIPDRGFVPLNPHTESFSPADSNSRFDRFQTRRLIGIVEPRWDHFLPHVTPVPVSSASPPAADFDAGEVVLDPDPLPDNVIRIGTDCACEADLAGSNVLSTRSHGGASFEEADEIHKTRVLKDPVSHRVNGMVNLSSVETYIGRIMPVKHFIEHPAKFRITTFMLDAVIRALPPAMEGTGRINGESTTWLSEPYDSPPGELPFSFVPEPVTEEQVIREFVLYEELIVGGGVTRPDYGDSERTNRLPIRVTPPMLLVPLKIVAYQEPGVAIAKMRFIIGFAIQRVNEIWKQAGIRFEWNDRDLEVNSTSYFADADNGKRDSFVHLDDPGKVTVFLVGKLHWPLSVAGVPKVLPVLGVEDEFHPGEHAEIPIVKLVWAAFNGLLSDEGLNEKLGRVLAHELGHRLNLVDEYEITGLLAEQPVAAPLNADEKARDRLMYIPDQRWVKIDRSKDVKKAREAAADVGR